MIHMLGRVRDTLSARAGSERGPSRGRPAGRPHPGRPHRRGRGLGGAPMPSSAEALETERRINDLSSRMEGIDRRLKAILDKLER